MSPWVDLTMYVSTFTVLVSCPDDADFQKIRTTQVVRKLGDESGTQCLLERQ
jgi:hypothetical protein